MPPLAGLIVPESPAFRTHDAVREPIREACAAHPDIASFHELGESEEGRELYAAVIGCGSRTVSLIAGAHADEPVGPESLRTFILQGLRRREAMEALFDAFTFVIVPHVNPDGEARNRTWIDAWPDLSSFLARAVREAPGRDLEFGFPDMRPENRAVSAFLRAHAPLDLHMSLHGMAFSEGAMLLIERHWSFRTQALRARYAAAAEAEGLPLHDHNREGEKGFFYIEPGFTTTPEGDAMRTYFRAQGDEETAACFHDSSMDFVRSLGGDPLCLVTELPLFLVRRTLPSAPGVPVSYLMLKSRLAEARLVDRRGGGAMDAVGPHKVVPVAPACTMRMHMTALEAGLEAVLGPLPV